MDLSLDLLLEQFSLPLPLVFIASYEERKFSGAALFSGLARPEAPDTLYVGALSDILALPAEVTAGKLFCCIGSRKELEAVRRGHTCDLLLFEPPVDLASCFNEFQRIFSSLNRLEEELDRLFLRKAGLQEIAEAFGRHYENPVYIWDSAYRIQGMAPKIETDHPILKAINESGRLPSEFLASISRSKDAIMQNTQLYTTLRLHYPPNVTNIQFAIRIFMAGQKSALVLCCFYAKSPATPGRVELLQMLVQKLEKYVKENYQRSQFKARVYEPLILDLVEGRLNTESDVRDRLRVVNLPYEACYRVYYVEPEEYSQSLLSYLAHSCKDRLPYAKVIQYGKGVLALDREEKREKDEERIRARLDAAEQSFFRLRAPCGISSTCENLLQVQVAFLQAKMALTVGRNIHPDKALYFYRDYYLYHMLEICSNYPELALDRIYFKALNRLGTGGEESTSDSLRLLEIYLLNNRNITNTARQMHLHRNSIIYRLGRIEKILGVPLEDAQVQLRILISLHIRRLQQAQHREKNEI